MQRFFEIMGCRIQSLLGKSIVLSKGVYGHVLCVGPVLKDTETKETLTVKVGEADDVKQSYRRLSSESSI